MAAAEPNEVAYDDQITAAETDLLAAEERWNAEAIEADAAIQAAKERKVVARDAYVEAHQKVEAMKRDRNEVLRAEAAARGEEVPPHQGLGG